MGLDRATAQSKIDAQRKAIREHIDKYKSYPYEQDKQFALKTIERCQNEIRKIKSQCNVTINDGYEDNWSP